MWKGHYYQFIDRWTPPLHRAPRWMAGNAYTEIDDQHDAPAVGSAPTYVAPTLPVGGVLQNWSLTNTGSIEEVSPLQSLVYLQQSESEVLHSTLKHLYYSRVGQGDLAEPDTSWVVQYLDTINKLEIQTSSGWVEVTRATEDIGLFYSAQPSYRHDGNIALLHGLDFVQTLSTVVSGWHYIPSPSAWNTYKAVFIQHPKTLFWIPLHYDQIRSDGFLGYYYADPLKIRFKVQAISDALSYVNIRINGTELSTASRVNLTTELDALGLNYGVSRLDGESLSTYSQVLKNMSWFSKKQTSSGLQNHISSALRFAGHDIITSSTTGVTNQSNTEAITVLDREPRVFVTEWPVFLDIDTKTKYRSIFSNTTSGQAYIEGRWVDYTQSTDTTLRLNTEVRTQTTLPIMRWVMDMWTPTASGLTFTSNMLVTQDTPILFAKKVRVIEPSAAVLRKILEQNSDLFRWKSDYDPELIQGSALFD